MGIVEWIKSKYLDRQIRVAKKREERELMFARINAKNFIREGWAAGEYFNFTIDEVDYSFIYMYSKLDEDYWLDVRTTGVISEVISTKEGLIKKIIDGK